jgi:hypothetical protein
MQPTSPMMMTPAPGPSDKLVQSTSALFLKTAQVAAVKVDTSVILTIDSDIEEYCLELQLLIDLLKECQLVPTDNTDYAQYIGILEGNL